MLHAATYKDNAGIARERLENGADPNARYEDRTNPLHAATLKIHAKAVKLMLECDTEVNAADKEG